MAAQKVTTVPMKEDKPYTEHLMLVAGSLFPEYAIPSSNGSLTNILLEEVAQSRSYGRSKPRPVVSGDGF